MKLFNKIVGSHLVILTIAIFSITGCASTGMQRSEDTRTTMETMDNDIKSASLQLDATGAALDNLMSSDQTNIQQAFDSYKRQVAKMEEMEKKFAKHAEQMKAKGNDYFEEWAKEGQEYKNPEIQRLSNERRAALIEIYEKIAENSIGVSEAFKTYVSDTKEIQTFLSNDLTPKGIEAITPTASQVVNDGEKLKQTLQNVQIAIQNARAEMSQSGTN
ncbi:MAG: DUF2959 family protein [Bacteroidota bacterium]